MNAPQWDFETHLIKHRTLLPVLIEECSIPDSLSKIKNFDLTEQTRSRLSGIINKLGKWLGKDAKHSLHGKKLDSEHVKDNITLEHGRRGKAYLDIVTFALGNKVSAPIIL